MHKIFPLLLLLVPIVALVYKLQERKIRSNSSLAHRLSNERYFCNVTLYKVYEKRWQQLHLSQVPFLSAGSSGYRRHYAQYSFQGVYGKVFNLTSEQLRLAQIPFFNHKIPFVDICSDEVLTNIVFITGANQFYFGRLLISVATIQYYYPNRTIVVYDFGLSNESVKQLSRLCNVKVTAFAFYMYPKHVKQLYRFAWKALAVHDALKHYPGVLWVDASVRLKSSNLSHAFQVARGNGGIALFHHSTTSNYAVTNPAMYDYLPTSVERQKSVPQLEAGALLVYRTRAIYQGVLLWWVLCSLTEQCITPPGSNAICTFSKDHMDFEDRWNTYARCHRFDQSALNIPLSNWFGFDTKEYETNNLSIMDIDRIGQNRYLQPKVC